MEELTLEHTARLSAEQIQVAVCEYLERRGWTADALEWSCGADGELVECRARVAPARGKRVANQTSPAKAPRMRAGETEQYIRAVLAGDITRPGVSAIWRAVQERHAPDLQLSTVRMAIERMLARGTVIRDERKGYALAESESNA